MATTAHSLVRQFCATLLFLTVSHAVMPQHPTPPPPAPKPSPNAPINQNAPQGLETLPSSSSPEKRSITAQEDAEVRLDVQRLYALATQLKDEVDNTDASLVLNVSLLKKAGDIEKLAKQIKARAKR